FTALPSQLLVPALHIGLHASAEHDGVSFGMTQFVPHAPQVAVAGVVVTSQPFAAVLLLTPESPLYQIEHSLGAQVGAPFVELQRVPQVPQFPALVWVFVSPPFVALPSQFPKPVLQDEIEHALDTHAGVAFAKLHTLP